MFNFGTERVKGKECLVLALSEGPTANMTVFLDNCTGAAKVLQHANEVVVLLRRLQILEDEGVKYLRGYWTTSVEISPQTKEAVDLGVQVKERLMKQKENTFSQVDQTATTGKQNESQEMWME